MLGFPVDRTSLGGVVIGASPQEGVVDAYHRVVYPGISIIDRRVDHLGNLGVNPSLTITAQAEPGDVARPNVGEADPRPRQGIGHVLLEPVPPVNPPSEAPGHPAA